MSNNFYASFEDKFRGSRELIKSRLRAYLPFIEPLLHIYPKGALVDLGCGRGEWLELTAETGFQPLGVDIDDSMLQYAQALGLSVQKMDALAFLKQLPDCSQTVVSGFHIVEHIAFVQLQQLVQEAKRVLVPGGLLILETPNPENLMVGTSSFYLDPTHQRPIPPDLLHFLTEYYGYSRQKIIRLQEPQHLISSAQATLMDVVVGVSPDYSVIAQAAATSDILKAFDTPFSQDYGLTLQALAERFQKTMTSQLDFAERTAKSQLQEALQVAQTAQRQMLNAFVKMEQAEALANSHLQGKQKTEAELTAVQQELLTTRQSYYDKCLIIEEQSRYLVDLHRSRFWRMTRLLRWVFVQMRQFRAAGLKAIIGAAVRKTAQKINHETYKYPALRRRAIACSRMLGVDTLLRRLLIKPLIQPTSFPIQPRSELIKTRLGENPGLAKEDLDFSLYSNMPHRKRSVDEIHVRISTELRQASES